MIFADIKKTLVGLYILSVASVFQAAIAQQQAPNQAVMEKIGKVVNVVSGDTVQLLLPDGELIQIRLAGLKAPSLNDEIGRQSHYWLKSQLNNQLVSAECTEKGTMSLCVVYPDERDINQISLYHGYSMCDEKSLPVNNPLKYRIAERHAQEKKLGIWNVN